MAKCGAHHCDAMSAGIVVWHRKKAPNDTGAALTARQDSREFIGELACILFKMSERRSELMGRRDRLSEQREKGRLMWEKSQQEAE